MSCLPSAPESKRTATRVRRGLVRDGVASIPASDLSRCSSSLADEFQRDPDAPVRDGLVHWCKREPGRSVAAVCLSRDILSTVSEPAARPIQAYWKCLHRAGIVKRLVDLITGGPARHVARIAYQMRACQITTPEPLAWAVRSNRAGQSHYLLTVAIPHSETADLYFARDRDLRGCPSSRTSEPFLERAARLSLLARLLRRLHSERFDHRDLKLQNILISQPGTSPGVWLLDLDGVRRWPWSSRTRAVQNLSRLAVSAHVRGLASYSDQLRFLQRYLTETGAADPSSAGGFTSRSGWSPSDWKWWWRAISQRAQQKLRQNQRRGRPLS